MIAFNLFQDVFGLIDETISTGTLLALLVTMLAASSAIYEWLEKPSRHVIRRWGDTWLANQGAKSVARSQGD
jgi:peptidoglycan/LPS O-acetylase OafA/YrhL